MSILEFFNAEILWPYVTGEKDIPRDNANIIPFYRGARNFGRLCAITSLEKATSFPNVINLRDNLVDKIQQLSFYFFIFTKNSKFSHNKTLQLYCIH